MRLQRRLHKVSFGEKSIRSEAASTIFSSFLDKTARIISAVTTRRPCDDLDADEHRGDAEQEAEEEEEEEKESLFLLLSSVS